MTLVETIYRRSSVRAYTECAVDAATIGKIRGFIDGAKPLYPDIRVEYEILEREKVRCIMPFVPPQTVAIFTEEREGAYENVGFIFQQLDLFLQSIGLGSCWLGMGRLDKRSLADENIGRGLKFVMMLAFGYPKGEFLRCDVAQFNRLPLGAVSDLPDERLEPARLAPSSVNSQPWYFTHDGEFIHTYCDHKKLRSLFLKQMNLIDVGIALSHIYLSNPESFEFYHRDVGDDARGRRYIGSFKI